VLMCRWPSMKPGMALMPLASIVLSPCVLAPPADTETIFPPRTITVPELITVPLPTDAGTEELPSPLSGRLRIDPNPFNPQAIVSFRIDHAGPVTIDLYDARGRRLDTLVQAVLPAGVHHVRLMRPESGIHLSSGVYFVRLRADGVETRQKAVLVK